MQWSDRIGRRLKPRDLHVFAAVAELGNMAKAAASLAISRPVVSKTILELEHTLGVPLFDRNPHGVEPTLYGRALLKSSVVIFDDLRQSVTEIESLVDPTAGELRLGCSDWAASAVGVAIDRLSRQYPRITFDVVSAGHGGTLLRELRNRNIELFVAILEDSFRSEDLDTEILYDDPLVVVADARHPLVRRRTLELADLVDEAWVLPPANTVAGAHVRDAFQKNGLVFQNTVVITYSDMLRHNLVATERFVTVLRKSVLEFMARSLSIKALPVHLPATRRKMAMVALKKRTLSPVARLFMETVSSVAKPREKVKGSASLGRPIRQPNGPRRASLP
jgi:DNA-binding transcriptional LysR family regulator